MIVALLVAVAGGVGAVSRFVLDGVIRSRVASLVPAGTFVINVSGSLLLGFVTGLVLVGAEPTDFRVVLGTGFLGGYTTFSTAMIETVRLLQQRRWVAAGVNGIAMLLLGLGAAVLGVFLGTLF
ncbi:fluoride efflux transporter CrcB [Gryllotalpicola protaetiae]|uniref:Fluoride-specific ion channel FluC n=1 Tax=Gryllotalpicola protaetiae TaxID=2419771 RepID=A0A387BHX4_9MICO|nr:fluoride efflux transporter CrcB [Gryllotalpicola protaetiae]AYG03645.1 fluoride efflux transporter CrcB [Gryllotalpicola protaetiae]